VRGKLYARLDKGVREKKGKHEEVKILETHKKTRIQKELYLVRRFLGMDCEKLTIHDEQAHSLY